LQNTAQLDPGESEAIALALEINANLLLIDERRGRTEANRLGIRITACWGCWWKPYFIQRSCDVHAEQLKWKSRRYTSNIADRVLPMMR
jgi:predicted nucleic acid-binding protein